MRSFEVAALAGVHRSTVSRALNPATAHLVNEATRQRVMAAVEQLSYHTNTFARSLKTRRSFTVGVLIPDITPLFPPVIRGADDVLHQHGYYSLVGYSDEDPGRAQWYLEHLLQRHVDGLVIAVARRTDPVLEGFASRGVPVVLVNRRTDDDRLPSVTVDGRPGITAVVRHLAGLGHTRIACIAPPQHSSTGHDRLVQFREAADSLGLAPPPGLLVEATGVTIAEGQRLSAELLERAEPPTAIVAANDTMALGCLDALRLRGLRCPDDISVVGFNDVPFAGRIAPALTTVRFDHYKMGETAAQILLGKIGVIEPAAAEHVSLPSELVVRESTGPVRAAPRLRKGNGSRSDGATIVTARLDSIERTLRELTERLA